MRAFRGSTISATSVSLNPDVTPLHAVYPSQRHLPPKVRACVDFLVERFGRETDWVGGG